jgi:hypothetical protein
MAAAEVALVVVAVVAHFLLSRRGFKDAHCRIMDAAAVLGAFVLVVAIVVDLALRRPFDLTAPSHAQRPYRERQHKHKAN